MYCMATAVLVHLVTTWKDVDLNCRCCGCQPLDWDSCLVDGCCSYVPSLGSGMLLCVLCPSDGREAVTKKKAARAMKK